MPGLPDNHEQNTLINNVLFSQGQAVEAMSFQRDTRLDVLLSGKDRAAVNYTQITEVLFIKW